MVVLVSSGELSGAVAYVSVPMPKFDTRITFDLAEETEREIEGVLEYGDSKAGFIRRAIRNELREEEQSE